MAHKNMITLMLSIFLSSLVSSAQAAVTTGWYEVKNVQLITQLIDKQCVDDETKRCPRNKYFRVYYQATSQYSPVQTFEKTMNDNPPQVGAVIQMTVDVPKK